MIKTEREAITMAVIMENL